MYSTANWAHKGRELYPPWGNPVVYMIFTLAVILLKSSINGFYTWRNPTLVPVSTSNFCFPKISWHRPLFRTWSVPSLPSRLPREEILRLDPAPTPVSSPPGLSERRGKESGNWIKTSCPVYKSNILINPAFNIKYLTIYFNFILYHK